MFSFKFLMIPSHISVIVTPIVYGTIAVANFGFSKLPPVTKYRKVHDKRWLGGIEPFMTVSCFYIYIYIRRNHFQQLHECGVIHPEIAAVMNGRPFHHFFYEIMMSEFSSFFKPFFHPKPLLENVCRDWRVIAI